MAISIAMFGMTVGALLVYLSPRFLDPRRARHYMAWSSFFLGLGVGAAFLTLVEVPSSPQLSGYGLFSLALTYAVVSLPFVGSGICVCLALTKFPEQVNQLYAADLAGAAMGCLFLIWVLKVTDALTAVVLVALLAFVATTILAGDGASAKLRGAARVLSLVAAVFVLINTYLVHQQCPLVRLRWIKGYFSVAPIYEKWNSFSRIGVYAIGFSPFFPASPEGFGFDYRLAKPVKKLALTIDGSAETTLLAYDGDLEPLSYLMHDVKEFVHYVGTGRDVLVVGSGGGRDILAALKFGQRSVRAVEINQDILRTVNDRFGDFTGRLDRDPRVKFVNDEARSYVARLRERFDIIQISFIDTWAATAAGAFALTENSLYTLEAQKLFIEHLTERGVLSVSRWYMPNQPAEAYRLTALAAATLRQIGSQDPRRHLFLVTSLDSANDDPREAGAVTLLVSRAPFSDEELTRLDAAARELHFPVLLSPRSAANSTFAALASGRATVQASAYGPLDISPPTDDRPFFFQMTRFRDALRSLSGVEGIGSWNLQAVGVLAALLVVVAALTILCVIVPLALTGGKASLSGAGSHLVYFGAIGLGYMLVEVSQLQRLIIFLGHPTYALSVVLFTLLISSGLGSYATERIGRGRGWASASACLVLLLAVLAAVGFVSFTVLAPFERLATGQRILIVACLLFPLGFLMGMPFPLGMKAAAGKWFSLTPWLWGVNGATSVCASVLAVVIAMGTGISAAYWTGAACYAVAFLSFLWVTRRSQDRIQP